MEIIADRAENLNMKCTTILQNQSVIANLLFSFPGSRFPDLIFRTFIFVLPVFLFGGLAWAQAPVTFSPSVSITNFATGPLDKPGLLLDQDITRPKGRLTLQRSAQDPGWSGLVLSINANWDSTRGYYRDVNRSQSFLQMEYEWDTGLGYRQNELNWTTNDRRIFNIFGKSDGFADRAVLNFMAPVLITVPQSDASSYGQPDPTGQWDPQHNHGTGTNALPGLLVESFQGAGSATQLAIQNDNHDSPAAAAQIVLRGAGSAGYPSSSATNWAMGTDRYWTGTNNFYIYDGRRSTEALFIDQTGKIGVGTTQPQKTLDVNGSITIGHGAATWTQGSSAPTANEPDGSLYSRVNSGVNSGLYVRQNGVWVKK